MNIVDVLLGRLMTARTADPKYFDITSGGLVSLKAAYRGSPANTTYSYSVSDNGKEKEGSLVNELPKKLIIPDAINGTEVTGFQPGAFYYNRHVREIVLPNTVTSIPKALCYGAINLRSIGNTEQITALGESAFQCTKIKNALFPNLQSLGQRAFDQCLYLETVDIGDEVTEVPYRCFQANVNLTQVKGGSRVTKIGVQGFKGTYSLKSLSFLENLTYVSEYAFFNSRIQADWDSMNCEFQLTTVNGVAVNRATPISDNSSRYWEGVAYKPCEHRLLTAMNQRNPAWAGKTYGTTGVDYTANGCGMMCMMHIHSAFADTPYASPVVFAEEVVSEDASLVSVDPSKGDNYHRFLAALNHKVTLIENAADPGALETLYSALANGAYAIIAMSGMGTAIDGNHAVVAYGVNNLGELLILDSDNGAHLLEVYDDLKVLTSSLPIQNFTGPGSNIYIVEKSS